MPPERSELVWAFVGNVIVAIGAGTLTVAAFVPSLPVVPDNFAVRITITGAGFIVFFWGYYISQAGTHRDPGAPLTNVFLPGPNGNDVTNEASVGVFELVRGGFVLAGALSLGASVRLFAVVIESWDPGTGVLAGCLAAFGYIFAHIGINWRVL